DEVAPRMGPSLLLTATAALLAVAIGVPFGVLSAINQYGRLDYILSAFTIGVISTPTFVLGLVFLFLFGVSLRWLPVGELFTFGKEGDIVDRLAHLVMPATILGLANAAPLGAVQIAVAPHEGLLRQAGRRFLRHRLAIIGSVVLLAVTFMALFLPALVKLDPLATDYAAIGGGPSSLHVLGADLAGRDVLARVVFGTQVSLLVGFGAVTIYVAIGTLLGLAAGLAGGVVDQVIMRLTG